MNYTKCWLEYPRICDETGKTLTVICLLPGAVAQRAVEELRLGLEGLYGLTLLDAEGRQADITLECEPMMHPEGYEVHVHQGRCTIIGGGERGALYGAFALLRQLQMEQCPWESLAWEGTGRPSNPMRVLNHWDDLDGNIERGYSGQSFFFRDNQVLVSDRTVAYARLAASVGINCVVLNNVNVRGAANQLISKRYYEPLREIQKILASYGIVMYLCVNFAAPMEIGGLNSADPCDGSVRQWWADPRGRGQPAGRCGGPLWRESDLALLCLQLPAGLAGHQNRPGQGVL